MYLVYTTTKRIFVKPRLTLLVFVGCLLLLYFRMRSSFDTTLIPSDKAALLQTAYDQGIKLVIIPNGMEHNQVLQEDLDPSEVIVSARDLEALLKLISGYQGDPKVVKETVLDPRFFNVNKKLHKEVTILKQIKIDWGLQYLFISIAYVRGSVDDLIEPGFLWIPAFGREGKARAFSRFKIKHLANSPFYVPANMSQYHFEKKASQFVECNYTNVRQFWRDHPNPKHVMLKKGQKEQFMRVIINLRREMESWGVYNIIFAGTLLGWYRQCTIIPHTTDADTIMFIEDYKPWMSTIFRKKNRAALAVRELGLPKEGLQYTFKDINKGRVDLFMMYTDTDPPTNEMGFQKGDHYMWMGYHGATKDHSDKGALLYPYFTRICSAALHEYRVFIPCDPRPLLLIEYGDEFSKVGGWYSRNFVIRGTWPNGIFPSNKQLW